MVDKKSTKLHIPQPAGDCTLVGILEQLEPDQPTDGRKIALILHGTMGHKDYLFQKRLAQRLPFDSFRFDFRGNHESGGQWKQGGFADDVEDLVTVVAYLRTTYGYEIDMVVGHSRGSVVGMYWLCTSEEGKGVRALVNVSGRYRMHVHAKTHTLIDGAEVYQEEFATKGYYDWNLMVARKPVVQRIYPQDLEEFSRWNSGIVWDSFPSSVDVLTIHGLADKTVPVSPGTHSLHLVEVADHNFTGRQDEVVDCILEWWEAKLSGSLVTGVFQTGVRGKL
ncbi:Alpha/Beta hydrolase protein [Melanogaster broomeanus]|nr:Alpha/Beta hydrolase protein [Melanogaster broomeanus]